MASRSALVITVPGAGAKSVELAVMVIMGRLLGLNQLCIIKGVMSSTPCRGAADQTSSESRARRACFVSVFL